jgi:hypothetical protein
MGNTPNNNFPYPEASGLVKDGWEDIKDLATSIDTKLGVYAPSTPGLTLINTTSFSGVSSASINDVFSATYNNYKVLITYGTAASANSSDTFRFRVAGADNSTTNYQYAGFLIRSSAATIPYGNTNQTSIADFLIHNVNGNEAYSVDIYTPFIAERTKWNALGFGQDGTSVVTHMSGGVFTATTSFTGFTLICSSGTFSPTISVYGVNK